MIDKKGRTPLHLASLHGHAGVARFIINELFKAVLDNDLRHKFLNLPDRKGRTPLFHAAAHGHSCVVRLLVDRGVELNTTTNKLHSAPGSTAIMACAENEHTECFNVLLDRGADLLAQRTDGADAFYLAAMNGRLAIIKSITTTDLIRIICHDIIDIPTYRGRTALCTAAFHGHLEVIKLLFENGANINHQDDDQFTPLILAAYEGHLKVVKWLLRNGADALIVDKFGDTALESAEICGHSDVTSFIEKWGDEQSNDLLRRESIIVNREKIKKRFKMTKSKLLAIEKLGDEQSNDLLRRESIICKREKIKKRFKATKSKLLAIEKLADEESNDLDESNDRTKSITCNREEIKERFKKTKFKLLAACR